MSEANDVGPKRNWDQHVALLSGTDKLAEALAAAQAEYKPLKRTKTVKVTMKSGGNFSYKYATLDACYDACRPSLSKNGLSVAQVFVLEPLRLVTTLLHSSGQQLQSVLPLKAGGSAQDLGAEMTYMRRYSLSALVGLAAAEEDMDGPPQGDQQTYQDTAPRSEHATQKRGQATAASPKREPAGDATPKKWSLTKAQRTRLFTIGHSHGWTDDQLKGELFLRYRIESTSDLTLAQYNELCGDKKKKLKGTLETPPLADAKDSPQAETQGGGSAGEAPSSAPEDPSTDAGDGGADTDVYAALAEKVLDAKGSGETKALLALAVSVGNSEGLTDEQRAALVTMLEE